MLNDVEQYSGAQDMDANSSKSPKIYAPCDDTFKSTYCVLRIYTDKTTYPHIWHTTGTVQTKIKNDIASYGNECDVHQQNTNRTQHPLKLAINFSGPHTFCTECQLQFLPFSGALLHRNETKLVCAQGKLNYTKYIDRVQIDDTFNANVSDFHLN